MNKPRRTASSLAAAQAALPGIGLAWGQAAPAPNLTDKIFKRTAQQNIGQMGRAWFSTGRRYTLSLRYSC